MPDQRELTSPSSDKPKSTTRQVNQSSSRAVQNTLSKAITVVPGSRALPPDPLIYGPAKPLSSLSTRSSKTKPTSPPPGSSSSSTTSGMGGTSSKPKPNKYDKVTSSGYGIKKSKSSSSKSVSGNNSKSSTSISLKGTSQRTTVGEHHTWSPRTQQSTRQSYAADSGSVRSVHKDKFASSTDQITAARHVWQYMKKYNDVELMEIRQLCKSEILDSDKETLILTAKPSRQENIDRVFDKFISVYQKISERITLQNYNIASLNQQDAEDLAERLETDYACVAFEETGGRLRVVCQKVEKDRIDRFVAEYNRMPKRKSMDLSSQFHPTGYLMAGGVQVFLHVCDITSMAVDAITDPANTGLRAYGGLSKVISTAAGTQFMSDECEKLLRHKRRELDVGEVVHTTGGRLHAPYVLHVAGPMWPKSSSDILRQQRCMDDLENTFHNVIRYADKLNLDNVAIPPISSGVFHVPLDYVAHAAHSVMKNLTKFKSVREIHFVDISDEFLRLLQSKFEDDIANGNGRRIQDNVVTSSIKTVVKTPKFTNSQNDHATGYLTTSSIKARVPVDVLTHARSKGGLTNGIAQSEVTQPGSLRFTEQANIGTKGKDRYAAKRTELEHGRDFKSKGFLVNGAVRVVLQQGDITALHTDAIVSPTNKYMHHKGGLAQFIDIAAGQELVSDCTTLVSRRGTLQTSEVVKTRPGKLPCTYVFHAVGPSWPIDMNTRKEKRCVEDLETTFCNVFSLAQKENIKSIACPAIGGGVVGIPLDYIARSMCEAVLNTIRPGSSLKEVHIVDIFAESLQHIHRVFVSNVKEGYIDQMNDSKAEAIVRASLHGSVLSKSMNDMHALTASPIQKTTPAHRKSKWSDDEYEEVNDLELYKPIGVQVGRNAHVYVHKGDMSTMRVPAIVCYVNKQLEHLDQDFFVKAGRDVKTDWINHTTKRTRNPIIRTRGGSMPAICILHVELPTFREASGYNDNYLRDLRRTIGELIYTADDMKLSSLAIPATSGVDRVKRFDISALSQAVFDKLPNCQHLNKIHLVGISEDILEHLGGEIVLQGTKLNCHILNDHEVKTYLQGHGGVSSRSPDTSSSDHQRSQAGITRHQPHTSVDQKVHAGSSPPGHQIGLLGNTARGLAATSTPATHTDTSQHLRMNRDVRPKEPGKSQILGKVYPAKVDPAKVDPVDETCVICLCGIIAPKTLPCKHTFCTSCIDHMFQKYQPKCPSCGALHGPGKGDQPPGNMSVRKLKESLPGYDRVGTIKISYSFENGTQGPEHPQPGQPYYGTTRTAYLPDNSEGQEILALMRQAFDAKLTFTIGRSVTTGADNVVTWNDIHHKTSQYGGSTQYGYPDATYLTRVRQELAAKGIK